MAVTSSEVRKGTARAQSLDALRGMAIIGMMVADNVPWIGLPAWMYHGQEPPPTHDFNPRLTGITWVDLVFPFFLFSMGASIPLAQSRRDSERPSWQNNLLVFLRGLLLVAFAVFNQHVRPEVVTQDSAGTQWIVGILGFILALGMFGRFPSSWPKWLQAGIKLIGWCGALFLLSRLHYPDPDSPGFSKSRSDVIILVLATVSVLGTYLWRATRNSFEIRAAIVAAIFVFRISASVPGSWESTLWGWTAQSWIFDPKFVGYLLIALPGAIAGDLLLRNREKSKSDWVLSAACILALPVTLIVFYQHANALMAASYGATIIWFGWHRLEAPIRSILVWGLLWLALGCLLEPFEGGIKKDPYTLSYLLSTSGLACFALVGFSLVPARKIEIFSSVGQNPLLAYQAVTTLIPSLCGIVLTSALKILPDGPAFGLLITFAKTLLLIALVAGFSKLKISMRI